MAQIRKKVHGYTGVYYQIAKRKGRTGTEKVYYYTFKNEQGKFVWEKAGRQFADDMTPARTSAKRALRLDGKIDSPQEKRKRKAEKKQAKAEKWTIDRLWDEYASHHTNNKSFSTDKSRYELYLKDKFGSLEPSEIIQLEVDRIRVKLLKKKSPQTVKHILALLKRIIKFGSDKGLCAPLPFTITLPKVDNAKSDVLAPDELEQLLKAIQEDKHPIAGKLMLMVLNTGMRRGELFRLQWNDIDEHNRTITLRQTKSGNTKKIPLNDGALKVLKSIKRTRSPYVFAGRGGNQRVDINKALSVIKRKAKLPKEWRPLHSLRHHFASMLASSGKVTPFALQTLLTHGDLRMTARYSHLFDEAAKKASNLASDIITEALNGGNK
jgi:integrase